MKIKHIALFATIMFCALAGPSLRPATTATARTTAEPEWFFVVIETHVSAKNVEVSSEHPEERRWYISNVAALPDDIPSYSAPKKVNEYFDNNVVSPAAKRGVVVQYYDQESQINGGSVLAMESREQAEEMRKHDIEDRKEQGGNIYSFNIVFGPAKGEESSEPRLIYRNKEQPNYETNRKP
jgi:hypothetical protein